MGNNKFKKKNSALLKCYVTDKKAFNVKMMRYEDYESHSCCYAESELSAILLFISFFLYTCAMQWHS